MKWTLALICLIGTHAVAADRDFTAAERKRAVGVVSEARDAFDLTLFDYPSARFRSVRASIDPELKGNVVLCGLVNGKNRSGAYIGWKAFAFAGGDTLTFDPILVTVLCEPSGSRIYDTKDYSADLDG